MNTFEPLLMLKLSIQRALLGEVTDRVIAVTCGQEERHIPVRAYISGKVTEEDIERIQFVGAGVIADFPEGYTIDEFAVSVHDGEPEMLDFWAFVRAKQ
jgi:hypothetical protein